MTALRFIAGLFILAAAIVLVVDASRARPGGASAFTPAMVHWQEIAPKSLANAKAAVGRTVHPTVWDLLIANVLALPTVVLFGGLGVLVGWLGRRRYRVNVFVN